MKYLPFILIAVLGGIAVYSFMAWRNRNKKTGAGAVDKYKSATVPTKEEAQPVPTWLVGAPGTFAAPSGSNFSGTQQIVDAFKKPRVATNRIAEFEKNATLILNNTIKGRI